MHDLPGRPSSSSALLAFLVVVGSGALGWFWTRPTIGAVRSEKAQINQYQRAQDEAKVQVQNLQKLQQNLEVTKGAAAELELVFPRTAQLPEVLVQLEAIAGASQMKVTSLSVDTSAQTGGVPISMATAGTFDQLKNFLELLESSQRPIVVKSISLAGTPEGAVTSSFTLSMLFLGTPEEPSAGEGAVTPETAPGGAQ